MHSALITFLAERTHMGAEIEGDSMGKHGKRGYDTGDTAFLSLVGSKGRSSIGKVTSWSDL